MYVNECIVSSIYGCKTDNNTDNDNNNDDEVM